MNKTISYEQSIVSFRFKILISKLSMNITLTYTLKRRMRPYLLIDDEFDAAFHNVHAMIGNGVELLC